MKAMDRAAPPPAMQDRVALARRIFRENHALCFWYLRKDLEITERDLSEIVRCLRKHGGRRGYVLAARICP